MLLLSKWDVGDQIIYRSGYITSSEFWIGSYTILNLILILPRGHAPESIRFTVERMFSARGSTRILQTSFG